MAMHVNLELCLFVAEPEDEHAPTIEMMWGGWKADSMRRLQPIMAYSQQLKVFTLGAFQAQNPLLARCRKGTTLDS